MPAHELLGKMKSGNFSVDHINFYGC